MALASLGLLPTLGLLGPSIVGDGGDWSTLGFGALTGLTASLIGPSQQYSYSNGDLGLGGQVNFGQDLDSTVRYAQSMGLAQYLGPTGGSDWLGEGVPFQNQANFFNYQNQGIQFGGMGGPPPQAGWDARRSVTQGSCYGSVQAYQGAYQSFFPPQPGYGGFPPFCQYGGQPPYGCPTPYGQYSPQAPVGLGNQFYQQQCGYGYGYGAPPQYGYQMPPFCPPYGYGGPPPQQQPPQQHHHHHHHHHHAHQPPPPPTPQPPTPQPPAPQPHPHPPEVIGGVPIGGPLPTPQPTPQPAPHPTPVPTGPPNFSSGLFGSAQGAAPPPPGNIPAAWGGIPPITPPTVVQQNPVQAQALLNGLIQNNPNLSNEQFLDSALNIRQLLGGSNVSSPPPTAGTGNFTVAAHRYFDQSKGEYIDVANVEIHEKGNFRDRTQQYNPAHQIEFDATKSDAKIGQTYQVTVTWDDGKSKVWDYRMDNPQTRVDIYSPLV